MTLADEPGEPPALRSGESVADAARLAVEVGAEALLFNCSQPEVMEPAIVEARMVLPPRLRVGAYANAFEQKEHGYAANGVILEHRAELNDGGYSSFGARWIDAGADIVGGCCGIMPEHIGELHALR